MPTIYPKKLMKMSELCLSDVVCASYSIAEPFTSMIVKRIEDNNITFFRSYSRPDSVFSGTVTCYIGVEEFTVPINDSHEFYVYQREVE